MTENKGIKKLFAAVIALTALLIIGAALLLIEKKNKYFACETHDMLGIDKLSAIDPALVIYSNTRTIESPVESPKAIAVDEKGLLYIAGDAECVVMDSTGSVRFRFVLPGQALCIGADENGDLFIGMKDRIMVYTGDGKEKGAWESLGPDAYLTSIAAGEEHVFASDAGNREIIKYKKDGTVLNRIKSIGMKGEESGFIVPSPHFDIALFDDDSLWAVNPGKHVLFNLNSEGEARTSWGKFGNDIDKFCGCCNPTDIALLPKGGFVTSEKGLIRVKTYGPDGSFKGVVAGPDAFSPGVSGLDIAAGSDGLIYVLDPGAGTVKVFLLKEGE